MGKMNRRAEFNEYQEIIIMAMSLLCSCGQSGVLRLGTGNTGGNYYSYGTLLHELDENGIEVKKTAGSQANLRLMNEGFIDMAIVQSDVLSEAVNGVGDFENEPVSGVRAVAGLYDEAFQIVVRSKSDINSIADLKGKKISVGDEGSGVAKNAEYLLLSAGVAFSSVEPVYMSYSDSAAALESGDIDAFFAIIGTPATVVSELAESTDIRIIAPDSRTIEYMLNIYKGYSEITIPAGTYHGQDEDIPTIGVKAVLVADSDTDRQQIKDITALLFGKSSSIKYSVAVPEPDTEFAVSDIPCSFHQGAADHYASVGITVSTDPENDGNSFIFGAQDN